MFTILLIHAILRGFNRNIYNKSEHLAQNSFEVKKDKNFKIDQEINVIPTHFIA